VALSLKLRRTIHKLWQPLQAKYGWEQARWLLAAGWAQCLWPQGMWDGPHEVPPELVNALQELSLTMPTPIWIEALGMLPEMLLPDGQAKQGGIVYTPQACAEWMVNACLAHTPYERLNQLQILEPAMGSGIFLRAALPQLIRPEAPLSAYAQACQWAEQHFYGVDIDPLAVTVARFLLRWECEQLRGVNEPVQHLQLPGLICLDALGGAPQGPLNINTHFPGVRGQGGFDWVIGNPPYVGEKGNRQAFQTVRQGPLGKFAKSKGDLFYFFFHLALEVLRPEGVLCLLTTHYYPTATGAEKLRADLQARATFHTLIDFDEYRLFPSAKGQHNLITLASRGNRPHVPVERLSLAGLKADLPLEQALETAACDTLPNQAALFTPQQHIQLLRNHTLSSAQTQQLDEMKAWPLRLGELYLLRQGIVTGADRLSPRGQAKFDIPLPPDSPIFILTEKEARARGLWGHRLLKPWFKNSDIAPGAVNNTPERYLLYLDRSSALEAVIAEHLQPFRPLLEARREVQAGAMQWWQLHWPRSPEIFDNPKLVVPQRHRRNCFAYAEGPWYASADVYFIVPQTGSPSLLTLMALLNSAPYLEWLATYGKRKGQLLELYHEPLSQIPLPKVSKWRYFSDK
jgi:adenine-specific DNA-methyltransferase